jgi:predicted murein hydrolase (TIGR00659 family)
MNVAASIWTSPVIWILVTLVAYQAAVYIYSKSGFNPVATPVLVGTALVICMLLLTGTPYRTYFVGAEPLSFLLGPAIVALAIPLYAQVDRLKGIALPLLLSLLVGSVTAIGSTVGIAWALGASIETLLSIAPKSVTMPIAIGISEKIGGAPPLTALSVTVTGLTGAIIGQHLLRLLRIDDQAVYGFATGITAHAIGTARALQVHAVAGGFAALAMGLNGLLTALLLPLIAEFIRIR